MATPIFDIYGGMLLFTLPFVLMLIGWFVVNSQFLGDRFNLLLRKGRTVKVNFHTTSGRNVERYIIPDKRGNMHISGGFYAFVKELSVTNAKHRIPEIHCLEGQIQPLSPEIYQLEGVEADVKVLQPDGSSVPSRIRVPQYVASFVGLAPARLNGLVAQEVEAALNSHIIEDIVLATDKKLQQAAVTFILCIVILAVAVLSAIVIYNKLDDVQTLVNTMQVMRGASSSP